MRWIPQAVKSQCGEEIRCSPGLGATGEICWLRMVCVEYLCLNICSLGFINNKKSRGKDEKNSHQVPFRAPLCWAKGCSGEEMFKK